MVIFKTKWAFILGECSGNPQLEMRKNNAMYSHRKRHPKDKFAIEYRMLQFKSKYIF
ncbi:unnamed protein product, partial [Callosobruchus maculatus]